MGHVSIPYLPVPAPAVHLPWQPLSGWLPPVGLALQADLLGSTTTTWLLCLSPRPQPQDHWGLAPGLPDHSHTLAKNLSSMQLSLSLGAATAPTVASEPAWPTASFHPHLQEQSHSPIPKSQGQWHKNDIHYQLTSQHPSAGASRSVPNEVDQTN